MARSTERYIKMTSAFASDVFSSELPLKIIGSAWGKLGLVTCQCRNKQGDALLWVPKPMRHSTGVALKYLYLCNSLHSSLGLKLFSIKMKASFIQKCWLKGRIRDCTRKLGVFHDSSCTDCCTCVACVTSDCPPVLYKNLVWQPFPSRHIASVSFSGVYIRYVHFHLDGL